MASSNPNAPFGFRTIRNRNGDAPIIATMTASASVLVPAGSPLRLKVDGTVAAWNGTFAQARTLVGVSQTPVAAADTVREVKVSIDPNAEYEVMLDDGSVTGINGLIGRNFRMVDLTSVTANATLLQSTQKLDASTGSSLNGSLSTNVRPFQAIRFATEVGNISSQSFARVIVRIRPESHIFGSATTTV